MIPVNLASMAQMGIPQIIQQSQSKYHKEDEQPDETMITQYLKVDIVRRQTAVFLGNRPGSERCKVWRERCVVIPNAPIKHGLEPAAGQWMV